MNSNCFGRQQLEPIYLSIFSIYLSIYLSGGTLGIQKFPGQGSNPHHSCDNARSFIPCATRELLHLMFNILTTMKFKNVKECM